MSTNITDNWQEQLDYIVDMMREMSRQTDPQEMVRLYAERVQQLMPVDARVSLSRRDLEPPKYRITRATRWKEDINPWAQPSRLPLLEGGLLGELLYGDAPRVINDLTVDPSDPAAEYLEGYRSLFAMPMYDEGVALNMVVLLRKQPHAFTEDEIPRTVWMGNLFGRATQNLVLHDQVRRAFDALDHEMQVIAEIQHSLLPDALPKVPTIEFAAHYQTSQRTGGDYYDLFHLRDNCLGILIADVSGHGSPAAVLMAILHSLVHTNEEDWCCPSHLFNYLNKRLAQRYTREASAFVTAFYGVYDPSKRTLIYALAGHEPPRLKRCENGTMAALNAVGGLPLGVIEDETYERAEHVLRPGDQILFYTDGITEAQDPDGDMFGIERLDAVLTECRPGADPLIRAVLDALTGFTAGRPADDDRTLLVAKIT